MPAAPEFGNALGQVGIVKVLNEVEAEDATQTDGHIAVAGEVKVDVQHEGNGIHPVEHHRLLAAATEQLNELAELIGKQNLFSKTNHKPAQAVGKIIPCGLTVVQFPCHIHITDDRAGNQLREQGNVSAEADGIFLGCGIAAVNIDGIAQTLEGVEADANGQRQFQERQLRSQHSVDRADEEVCIFENTQQ